MVAVDQLGTNWEVITGSKLGIKARGKTMLTAYGANGRPREVKDPKLFTAYGTRLCPSCRITLRTSIPREVHACGRRRRRGAWAKLLSKLEAGLSRLRSLHKVSLNTRTSTWSWRPFSTGLSARRAPDHVYLTFEQCGVVEAKWRAVYGAQYRRIKSAPRAPL